MRESRTTRAGWMYDTTIAVLVLGACLFGVVTVVVGPAVLRAVEVMGPAALATVVGLGLACVVLAVVGQLGPVWVTAPERTWRVPNTLLRDRSRTVVLGSVAGAALVGGVVAAAVPGAVADRALWGCGAAGVAGLAVAAAGAAQRLDRSGAVRTLGMLLGIAAVVTALATTVRGSVPLVVVGAAAVCAMLVRTGSPDRIRTGTRAAARWRSAPPLWELRRAGAVVEALWMSTVMLDSTPLGAVTDAQRAPSRRRIDVPAPVRPLVRTVTSSPVVDLGLLLAVPAAVAAIGGSRAGVVAALVLTSVLSRAVTNLLDVWVDTPVLARTFATSSPPLGPVLILTSLTLTGAYALITCALAGLNLIWAAVATTVAVLVWSRRLSGRRTGTEFGALLATPAGPVPVTLAQRLVVGTDVLVLSILVLPPLTPGVALAVCAAAVGAYLVMMTRRGR